MEQITFETFFNDVPLYSKKRFRIYEIKDDLYVKNKEELAHFISASGFGGNKIESLCNVCKKDTLFRISLVLFFQIETISFLPLVLMEA